MQKSRKLILVLVIVITVLIGLVCIYTGIALIDKANQPQESPSTSRRSYSKEGKRIGLEKLLLKVQAKYFELYPNKIANKPGVSADEVKRQFKPYDPKPLRIKDITDSSRKLVEELENLQVSTEKLKQFEKRAIAQAKYWVYHVFPFGVPYSYDYYTGDWMLGPDIFCWTPICRALSELTSTLFHYFTPITIEDLELVKVKIQEAGKGFETYVDNLRFGVSAGMVRNVETCVGGWTSFASTFRAVEVHGEKGILKDQVILPLVDGPHFMAEFKPEEAKQWKDKHDKTPKESLKEFLVVHLGRPVHQTLRYLKLIYSKHCVSSNISSGMSSLPLKYVYVNNQPTIRTTGVLPTGEPLDGKKSYRKLLSYWTTTGVTPDQLYKLGSELTEKLYDEFLQLAQQISGEKDNEKTKASILTKINEASNYFNTQPIPANESNEEAYLKCVSMETAKIHCPVRWQAMTNWYAYVMKLSGILRYKVLSLFHFTGPKTTVPSCPVKPKAHFNPATAAAFYVDSDAGCHSAAEYYIPFFMEKMGSKSEEWTISAHETIPGHHLQGHGYVQYFSRDQGVEHWLSSSIYFLTFAEGWALYAESHLIANETDTYQDLPLMKFEALKWQLMRAVRLIVDIGLHFKNMSRYQAMEIMSKYLWDNNDRINKELNRYQSVPGQSISYIVGQLQILKIREKMKKKLGNKYNIKDFHYYILRQGRSPLDYLDQAMDKYANCELNNDETGCDEVLLPPKIYSSDYDEASNEYNMQQIYRPSFLVH